jgi:alkaline phosphatase
MRYKSWKTHKCKFKEEKPLKYLYPNQKELLDKFSKFILPYLKEHPFFKKVWVWGSLARGNFGIYKELYHKQEGSDIDLLVEVDESYEIPPEFRELKEWTKKRTYSRAFYSKVNFKNKLSSSKFVNHKVDFICHFPSKNTKEGFYNKVKESKLIYNKGELSFSIFTDVHYDPRKIENTSKGIKGEESVKNFPALINKLKKIKQDFIVNLGDLVEAEPKKSFKSIQKKLREIPYPIFHVIGNHELELLPEKKLKEIFNLKNLYYSEEKNGFKLIFLNAFDMKSSKPDHRRKSRIIGGPLSKKQIQWLEKELEMTKGKAIIFCHKLLTNQKLTKNPIWSIAPERYTKVENSSEIRKVLEKSKKVLAVFQGHIHQNSMVRINNIPYFSIQGFCQNKNYSHKQKASKSYAIVNLSDNSILVEIKGDKKRYKI